MKFTLSWLKDHLETDATLDEICARLTAIGLEVEDVDDKAAFKPFVIARVLSAEKHPQADRLKVLSVDTGKGAPIQVVCGAPNARAGLVGAFAAPGTYVPGIDVTLSVGNIRGVESHGMMCSEKELMISDNHDGIIDLPEDAPVGTSYAAYAHLDDPVIEINLTPNRPDCTSIHGIARDLAASGLGKLKTRPAPSFAVEGETPVKVKLDLDDEKLCPGFALRLVRGVKNGPSPRWMQQRLLAIGLRPINALVDITNYMTFDQGRPMHVFDAAKVNGNLTVRRAKEGETVLALDQREYKLGPNNVVIADADGIESIGGVMGGEHSGCDENTTDVLIESALWDPMNIAKSGRGLGIITDARYRFERGVDPEYMMPGLERTTELVLELCGGTACEGRSRRLQGLSAEDRRFPLFGSQAPDRPRSLDGGEQGHPDPPRLHGIGLGRPCLRRRSFLASGCGRQGRPRRGNHAHPRRRQHQACAAGKPCGRQRQDPDDAADPHPHRQARARCARHAGGRHLVLHFRRAGEALRRRFAGAEAGEPDCG